MKYLVIKNKQAMIDLFIENATQAAYSSKKVVVSKCTLGSLIGYEVVMDLESLYDYKMKIKKGSDEKYFPVDVIIDKGPQIEVKNSNNTLVLEML